MPPHGGKYGITSVYSHTEYAFAVFLVLYRHAPAKPSTQRQTVASAQASLHGYSSTTTERYFCVKGRSPYVKKAKTHLIFT